MPIGDTFSCYATDAGLENYKKVFGFVRLKLNLIAADWDKNKQGIEQPLKRSITNQTDKLTLKIYKLKILYKIILKSQQKMMEMMKNRDTLTFL